MILWDAIVNIGVPMTSLTVSAIGRQAKRKRIPIGSFVRSIDGLNQSSAFLNWHFLWRCLAVQVVYLQLRPNDHPHIRSENLPSRAAFRRTRSIRVWGIYDRSLSLNQRRIPKASRCNQYVEVGAPPSCVSR